MGRKTKWIARWPLGLLAALLPVWACLARIGRKPRMPRDTDVDSMPDFGETAPPPLFEETPRRPLLSRTELGLPFDLTDPLPEPAMPEPAAPEPAAPEPETAADPPAAHKEESVAALMARLEAGLARRSGRQPAATVTPLKPPQPDDPLRSALEELQRMARNAR